VLSAMLFGLVDGCPLPSTARLRSGPGRDVVAWLGAAQATVLRPVQWIGQGANVRQRWKLFPVASRQRYRMWIEGREPDGAWMLLYRPHDPEHTSLSARLEYRRIRGLWNPGTHAPRAGYPAFATWVAGVLLARDARLHEIRVRMEKIEILPRGRGFRGTGRFQFELVRGRAASATAGPGPTGATDPPDLPGAP
jgi:hypothetical protein